MQSRIPPSFLPATASPSANHVQSFNSGNFFKDDDLQIVAKEFVIAKKKKSKRPIKELSSKHLSNRHVRNQLNVVGFSHPQARPHRHGNAKLAKVLQPQSIQKINLDIQGQIGRTQNEPGDKTQLMPLSSFNMGVRSFGNIVSNDSSIDESLTAQNDPLLKVERMRPTLSIQRSFRSHLQDSSQKLRQIQEETEQHTTESQRVGKPKEIKFSQESEPLLDEQKQQIYDILVSSRTRQNDLQSNSVDYHVSQVVLSKSSSKRVTSPKNEPTKKLKISTQTQIMTSSSISEEAEAFVNDLEHSLASINKSEQRERSNTSGQDKSASRPADIEQNDKDITPERRSEAVSIKFPSTEKKNYRGPMFKKRDVFLSHPGQASKVKIGIIQVEGKGYNQYTPRDSNSSHTEQHFKIEFPKYLGSPTQGPSISIGQIRPSIAGVIGEGMQHKIEKPIKQRGSELMNSFDQVVKLVRISSENHEMSHEGKLARSEKFKSYLFSQINEEKASVKHDLCSRLNHLKQLNKDTKLVKSTAILAKPNSKLIESHRLSSNDNSSPRSPTRLQITSPPESRIDTGLGLTIGQPKKEEESKDEFVRQERDKLLAKQSSFNQIQEFYRQQIQTNNANAIKLLHNSSSSASSSDSGGDAKVLVLQTKPSELENSEDLLMASLERRKRDYFCVKKKSLEFQKFLKEINNQSKETFASKMRNFERFQRLKQLQGNLCQEKNPFEAEDPQPSLKKASRRRYPSKEKTREQLNIKAVKVNLPNSTKQKPNEVHEISVNPMKSNARSPKTVELSFKHEVETNRKNNSIMKHTKGSIQSNGSHFTPHSVSDSQHLFNPPALEPMLQVEKKKIERGVSRNQFINFQNEESTQGLDLDLLRKNAGTQSQMSSPMSQQGRPLNKQQSSSLPGGSIPTQVLASRFDEDEKLSDRNSGEDFKHLKHDEHLVKSAMATQSLLQQEKRTTTQNSSHQNDDYSPQRQDQVGETPLQKFISLQNSLMLKQQSTHGFDPQINKSVRGMLKLPIVYGKQALSKKNSVLMKNKEDDSIKQAREKFAQIISQHKKSKRESLKELKLAHYGSQEKMTKHNLNEDLRLASVGKLTYEATHETRDITLSTSNQFIRDGGFEDFQQYSNIDLGVSIIDESPTRSKQRRKQFAHLQALSSTFATPAGRKKSEMSSSKVPAISIPTTQQYQLLGSSNQSRKTSKLNRELEWIVEKNPMEAPPPIAASMAPPSYVGYSKVLRNRKK